MSTTSHIHDNNKIEDGDSLSPFIINTITRAITTTNKKLALMQYDNDSERYTFEVDRIIDNHDLMDCNRVRIHFINIGTNKQQKNPGTYLITDMKVKPSDDNKITFTWLISKEATIYNGILSFLVSFECVDGDAILYRWSSSIFSQIQITIGMDNSDTIYEMYSDELLAWQNEMETEFIPELVGKCYVEREFATSEEVASVFDISNPDSETKVAVVTLDELSSYVKNDVQNKVDLSSDQIIDGIKTFKQRPLVGDEETEEVALLSDLQKIEITVDETDGKTIKSITKDGETYNLPDGVEEVITNTQSLPSSVTADSPDFMNVMDLYGNSTAYIKQAYMPGFNGSNLANTSWKLPYPVGDGLTARDINYQVVEYPDIIFKEIWINSYYNDYKGCYRLYQSGSDYKDAYHSITINILSGADITDSKLVSWLKQNATFVNEIQYKYVLVPETHTHKTINGQTITGEGDIKVQTEITTKTINGETILGEGDIKVQEVLESGKNIKTINGESILGEGDIEFPKTDEITINDGKAASAILDTITKDGITYKVPVVSGDGESSVGGETGSGSSGESTQKVLWTNPNPFAGFENQTITTEDMSEYDYIMINFYHYGNVGAAITSNIFKYNTGDSNWISKSFIGTDTSSIRSRNFKFNSPTSITFNGGAIWTNPSSIKWDSLYAVPYQIIGINFNSSSSSNGGSSSRYIGEIFASALPQTDSGVHLLDGSTIALDGIYKDFVNLVKKLVSEGYNLTCTQEEYEAYVSATGSCGKFVLDEVNNTLRLPTITTFIQGLTDLTTIGTAVEAGLPNITGEIDYSTYEGVHTGAFSEYSRTSYKKSGTGDLYFDRTIFNASLSNTIYGNSDTVQPPAVQYPYYIVLANTTKTDVEVNIDNIISELNNKAENNYAKKAYDMPSDTYETLSFTTSGQTFTAPANGWFCIKGSSANASHCYLNLLSNMLETRSHIYGASDITLKTILPTKKGDIVTATYGSVNNVSLIFIYSEGEI